MNIDKIISLATELHKQSLGLLPSFDSAHEPGKPFLAWSTAGDRLFPEISPTPLSTSHARHSAHERVAALTHRENATATFHSLCEALGENHLLGDMTHVEIHLGTTPKGAPTYQLYIDETTAHNTQSPVTENAFRTKLIAIKTAMDLLAGVVDKTPHKLFKETELGTTVSAPSPEVAALKMRALLIPSTFMTPEQGDLHTYDMATYHDPERIMDKVADLERLMKKDRT